MAKSVAATLDVEGDTQKTTLRLPKPLYKQLCHAAIDEERRQQDIVAEALMNYFSSRKKSMGGRTQRN